MKQLVKKLLERMMQYIKANPPSTQPNKRMASYHLYMEEDPNVRMSVLFRPDRFVVSVHFVGGKHRGMTIARIVEHYTVTDRSNYFNEDWLYPEANHLMKMQRL